MTPAERLRKHQRALEKTQRELDRERVKLENQEKKLVADIKKSAKNGQMGPLRIQAKDLVRTRRYAIVQVASHKDCGLILGQIYSEVLPDADTTAGHLAEDTGTWYNWAPCIFTDSRQTVRSNEQMMQSMKGATSTSIYRLGAYTGPDSLQRFSEA